MLKSISTTLESGHKVGTSSKNCLWSARMTRTQWFHS
jgi:hypothetical protein